MFDPNADKSPINALPPVVIVLGLIIGGVEIVLQLAAQGYIGGIQGVTWRNDLVFAFGFFGNVFDYLVESQNFSQDALRRFVTYPIVHFSAMHAGFAVLLILAIGKFVAEIFHPISVLVLFFISSITGALAVGILGTTEYPLIGAYPAVYGLIGAYTWILWLAAGADRASRLRAFQLAGILLALQLFYRFSFGGSDEWIAEFAGFFTGFLLSFVLAPDGRQRILRWREYIRDR